MPKPPSTSDASEGTRLHKLAADVLTGKVQGCTSADLEIIGPYVETVRASHEQHGGELSIEQRIHHPLLGEGTPDAVTRAPQLLIIDDLKTGWRLVEAERNWQLLMYACMIDPPMGTVVKLRITQVPPYHPEGPVRTWTVEPDLVVFGSLIRKAMKEAREAPRLVATPSNCLYCSAVTSCEAARNATLGGMDMALRQTGPLAADAIRPELVALRNAVALGKSRLASLEAEAEARMRGGEMVPGCAMDSGRAGSMEWSADVDKVRAVCAMVGQSADAPVALRTPTQMIEAGVPEAMVKAVSKRRPSKMSVSTDAVDKIRKLFS